ncbi:L,D-transpeptidase [Hyphomicrobium sp. DY-1]|uniref:L,D-transpeptidase n=1 Tax=Hyphomicrobium sp. DY-1 TaxID=3075650 RepID=UPI0039C4E337
MLRRMMLAAILFAAPSVAAMAEPSEAPANGASTTTETQSGTTTYFGKAEGAKEPVTVEAKKEPVAKPRPLPPTLTASIDLSRQTMSVSVNGELRYRWRISSGTQQYATPTGNFYPQWTSRMWYSKKYDNAPMPNAVFINGGVAVHGTYHMAALGRPASHGCIRLAPSNAKIFYDLVQRHGMMRTRVSVHGRPNWGDSAVARRDSRDDDDYASNGGSSFWGNIFGGPQSAKANGKKTRYVYIDGVRTKVYQAKDGTYYYKRPKGKKYSGYAYGAN